MDDVALSSPSPPCNEPSRGVSSCVGPSGQSEGHKVWFFHLGLSNLSVDAIAKCESGITFRYGFSRDYLRVTISSLFLAL